MKNIAFTLIGLVFITGCYTQFEPVNTSSQPVYSKVETKYGDSVTVTDYYDNTNYSWYFRNFNYGFGARYYDTWNYYDPYPRFYGGYNWGYNPYSYDYLDYRMDRWYWQNFAYFGVAGFWPYYDYYYGYPVYGSGENHKKPSYSINRQSRSNVYAPGQSQMSSGLSSHNSYLPVISTTSDRAGRLPAVRTNRPTRTSTQEPAVILQGSPVRSSSSGASGSTKVSSDSPAPARQTRSSSQPTVKQPDTPPSSSSVKSTRSSGSTTSKPARQSRSRND